MQDPVIGGQMISPRSPEGTHHINSLISMYGFDQLISDPTHILPASSSHIDLILLINLT